MRRDVFQAIADPTRREIIALIANKSLTANDVADNFEVSRQAISKHIKILSECGLILISQKGRERYCFLQQEKLSEVDDWLSTFRQSWEHKFDKLDTLLATMGLPEKKEISKQKKITKKKKRKS